MTTAIAIPGNTATFVTATLMAVMGHLSRATTLVTLDTSPRSGHDL